MAWMGTLLRAPQVAVNAAGPHPHLEFGVVFQARAG